MLLDVHTALMLQNGWELYGKDPAAFALQFPETVAADYLTRLHGVLLAAGRGGQTGPRFFTHQVVGPEALPCVVAVLEGEDPIHEPLGSSVGVDAEGRNMFPMLVRQHVGLHLYTYNPDVLRALTVVVRAIALVDHKALFGLGYASFEYEGMGEIDPQDQLVSERGGVFARVMRWSAITDVCAVAAGPVPDPKPWFIHTSNLASSASAGGVQHAPLDPDNPAPPARVLDFDGDSGLVAPAEGV